MLPKTTYTATNELRWIRSQCYPPEPFPELQQKWIAVENDGEARAIWLKVPTHA